MDITELLEKGGGIILILLTFIQITPIQINPLSFILKSMGKAMNEEIDKKIVVLDEAIKEIKDVNENLEKKFDKRNADSCRTRILRFTDELRRGVGHSEEFFNQVLEDISDYENFCNTHEGYKNGKAVNAIEHIQQEYKRCLENDDFL